MHNQQHGDYRVKADNGGFSEKQLVGSHLVEMKKEIAAG
jgi:hypothetical protein